MGRNIQLPIGFLKGVSALVEALKGHELDETTRELCNTLEATANAKLEAIEKRQIFSEYKATAPNTTDREEKRQEYLDKAQIHKDWRSGRETPT